LKSVAVTPRGLSAFSIAKRFAITSTPLLERQRGFLWPKLCGKVWPLESVESKLSKLSKTYLSIQLNAL
jgi:hypothetical protein